MATTKVLIVSSVLLCIMLLQLHHLAEAEDINFTTQAKASYPSKINCSGACKSRCKLSSRPNLCHRACGTCCARCSCVPPGTSGNKEVCPCYATMTTHDGRLKCP